MAAWSDNGDYSNCIIVWRAKWMYTGIKIGPPLVIKLIHFWASLTYYYIGYFKRLLCLNWHYYQRIISNPLVYWCKILRSVWQLWRKFPTQGRNLSYQRNMPTCCIPGCVFKGKVFSPLNLHLSFHSLTYLLTAYHVQALV